MQVAIGLFGLGRLMAYLPHVVLAGFMSGIGCFLIGSVAKSGYLVTCLRDLPRGVEA